MPPAQAPRPRAHQAAALPAPTAWALGASPPLRLTNNNRCPARRQRALPRAQPLRQSVRPTDALRAKPRRVSPGRAAERVVGPHQRDHVSSECTEHALGLTLHTREPGVPAAAVPGVPIVPASSAAHHLPTPPVRAARASGSDQAAHPAPPRSRSRVHYDPTKARCKGVSPILVQMWQGASLVPEPMWQGASPVPAQMWHSGASPVPARVCARRDGRRRIGRVSAWPCRCCDGSISAPFPLRPYSHLVRASAWPCRCCDGSTYYSAPRSARAKVWSEPKRSCVAV
jgi:hypothetical protein